MNAYSKATVGQTGSHIFTFGVDPEDVKRVKRELGSELADRVRPTVAAAINATAAMLRKEVARVYSRETGLRIGIANKRLWANKARTAHKLRASVRLGAYGMPYLAELSQQTDEGVLAPVGSRSRMIPHAFIREMESGHVGVFLREAGVKVSSRTYKQGIREVADESATAVLTRTGQVEPMRQMAGAFLSARISREIDKLFVGGRR